jgi:hypothetical protein
LEGFVAIGQRLIEFSDVNPCNTAVKRRGIARIEANGFGAIGDGLVVFAERDCLLPLHYVTVRLCHGTT